MTKPLSPTAALSLKTAPCCPRLVDLPEFDLLLCPLDVLSNPFRLACIPSNANRLSTPYVTLGTEYASKSSSEVIEREYKGLARRSVMIIGCGIDDAPPAESGRERGER
jgi:hypothetical protein